MRSTLVGVALCCSLLAYAAPGQEITIHLLNAQNGKPISAHVIFIYLTDKPAFGKQTPIQLTTDKQGTATLKIVEPLPSQITVEPASGDLRGCTDGIIPTNEVLEHGLIKAGEKCGTSSKMKGNLSAKPGELVILVHVKHWWERGIT
jgi:hypothetical protein